MQQEILLQAKGFDIASQTRLASMQNGPLAANDASALNSALSGNSGFYGVRFWLTPEISESGQVQYAEISEVRAPASFLIYMGSPSRTFNINAKLLSRTQREADGTWRDINILRSWRMPETGADTVDGTGNGPSIINLYGYGKMFQAIPTVMTSLNLEFSSEVDYIKNSEGTDIPILMNVSITLKEAHAHQDITNGQFNIIQYRTGNLKHWT